MTCIARKNIIAYALGVSDCKEEHLPSVRKHTSLLFENNTPLRLLTKHPISLSRVMPLTAGKVQRLQSFTNITSSFSPRTLFQGVQFAPFFFTQKTHRLSLWNNQLSSWIGTTPFRSQSSRTRCLGQYIFWRTACILCVLQS